MLGLATFFIDLDIVVTKAPLNMCTARRLKQIGFSVAHKILPIHHQILLYVIYMFDVT